MGSIGSPHRDLDSVEWAASKRLPDPDKCLPGAALLEYDIVPVPHDPVGAGAADFHVVTG